MPGGSRNRTPSWWSTAPATGPTSTSGTVRGNRFQVVTPGRVFGLRVYANGLVNQCWALLAYMEGGAIAQLLAAKTFAQLDSADTAAWRNCWFHPAVRVETGIEYYAAVMFPQGRYWRTIGQLNGSIDNPVNGIAMTLGRSYSNFNIIVAAGTDTFDVFGVDVLFMPDNYEPQAYP